MANMKTLLIQLPSGRIVRGHVIEHCHGMQCTVEWAGLRVSGFPLSHSKLMRIERGEG